MTYAVIVNNKVANLISWNGTSIYEVQGTLVKVEVNQVVSIGMDYLDGTFIDNSPPVEEVPA